MQALAKWALNGPGHATGLIVAMALLGFVLPPLSLISAALVALVFLQADTQRALLVLVASVVLCSLLGAMLVAAPALGLTIALVLWAPVAGMAVWLRNQQQLNQALLLAAVVALGTVVVIHLLIPNLEQAWTHLLSQRLLEPLAGTPQEPQAQEVAKQLAGLAPLLPGFLGMSVMLTAQIALLIGRWMQSQQIRPGAFGREFRSLQFGKIPMLAVAGIIALAFVVKQPAIQSMALVVAWLPCLQGIAVVHAFCKRPGFTQGTPVLVMAWILMILIPHVMAAVAALGAIDNWTNFRTRWPEEADSEKKD